MLHLHWILNHPRLHHPSPSRARSSPARLMPAPPSPSLLRRRLGTWHALALGTPWHLARDRRDRASVDYACSSRPLVVCARCACSPCLCFCSCVTRLSLGGRPGTWLDLALGTPVWSSRGGAALAQMHCRHTCIAGTHALQAHLHCSTHWADAWGAVDLYPYLQERGWDGYRPLNGCSQGLVVRGISPPEPCLYTCHTKVFSKVSNSPPIHQYFPAASPYGAQPGGWIGKADCYL
jgi:hypothetical protein